VGFDRIIIRPQPVGDLTGLRRATIQCAGESRASGARRVGSSISISGPVGAIATVFVPAKEGAEITDGGKPIDRAAGSISMAERRGIHSYLASDTTTSRLPRDEQGTRSDSGKKLCLNAFGG